MSTKYFMTALIVILELPKRNISDILGTRYEDFT
jgi:hypothetical protein